MIKSRDINENISVSYIPMAKLKTTSMGIYIHCPLNRETASNNAILASILKQGSKDYPTRDVLVKKLNELYGASIAASVSKKGEDHVLSFEAECISDKYTYQNEKLLNELFEVVFSIIFRANIKDGSFDKTVFSQEQKNLIDRINASVNDKRVYANEHLCEITCEGTPYEVSRLGDKDTVLKITPESLYEYYKRIITSSKIDIFVSGEVDFESFAKKVEDLTDGLSFISAKIPTTALLSRRDEVKTVTDRMEVTQGKLAMSFTTEINQSSEKYWGLTVGNSIFGGGAHSKLFNNVREKLSLAYYAGSQLHKMKGFIAVNAGVEFANFDKARDEILLQLEELKKGNISEQELNAAKMALINSLNSYYDDQLYMQSFYLGEKIAGTNYTIDEYIKRIDAVTVKDITDAAESITLSTVYMLAGRE